MLLLKAAGSRGQDHQDLRCPRSGRANHRDPVTPPHLPGGKPGSGPPPGREFSTGSTWASPPGSAAKPAPTEGRSSVSTEQRENLEAILRQSAFPAGMDLNEQRRQLRELISAVGTPPSAAAVTVTSAGSGWAETNSLSSLRCSLRSMPGGKADCRRIASRFSRCSVLTEDLHSAEVGWAARPGGLAPVGPATVSLPGGASLPGLPPGR